MTVRALLACTLLALAGRSMAAATEEDLFFKSTLEVNEGVLTFLTTPPTNPTHHHQNRLTIFPSSLDDGWVKLEQCHEHIDAVPSSQIVYREDRIRDLRLTRVENIGKVWVQGHTVQMENIAPAALLCVLAQTRALSADGNGGYTLSNGPYMRRFLDGYYPMRVSVAVLLRVPGLRYVAIAPPAQDGFAVYQDTDEVGYDTWFEGELNTHIRFTLAVQP